MTNRNHICDQMPLELVLRDDGAGEEVRRIADHVERCDACQSRLEALAADNTWWDDTRESLSGGDSYAWSPDAAWSTHFPPDQPPAREPGENAVRQLLSPPSHPELLGRLGRYDIERVIGAGGMGIVLKAHDSDLNRPVAIKLLAVHLAHVGAARERFAREGRAAAAVVHEHVVAIYNVEASGEVPFLVMQYVPGRSLQARVDAEGPLTIEEILRVGMQAAAGLAAAHAQGLVHRDVKPANILLEDSVERAVLTDFGLARTIDDASLTHTGVLAGTPHYMSPEQAVGQPVDHRSDLFSLGAVLYFMATGHPPFRAEGALAVLHRICRDRQRPIWQTNPHIPDELCDLVDQLLEKKPGRRPASALEVRDHLAGQLSRVQQYGPGRKRLPMWRGRRRRRAIGWTAAGALLVMALAIPSLLRTNAVQDANQPATHTDGADVVTATQRESELNADFLRQLQATREAVELSEHASTFGSLDDGWSREVETLRQELAVLESQQSVSLENKESK